MNYGTSGLPYIGALLIREVDPEECLTHNKTFNKVNKVDDSTCYMWFIWCDTR